MRYSFPPHTIQFENIFINCRKSNSSVSVVGSPPVSMREVMAEAEAEQKRRKGQEHHKVATRANEAIHGTNGER
jgi:hypothetical protein